MAMLLRLIAALLLLLPSMAFAADSGRRIAVTIDDLPWARLDSMVPRDLQAWHTRLIASLRTAAVPVVGFVNESKLEEAGAVQPARVAMLVDWLDAGFELGNHTWGHVDLHAVGVEAFQADILKGERQLRPLLAGRGGAPRWFRHPYLRAGRTPEDKAAVVDFLAQHGYRVAPVTVDNGEWVWAFAYANVLAAQRDTPERAALLRRLERGYVPYMLNKLDYYEAQSQALLGYALPQVWLMHANELNAVAFGELVAGAKRRGYRFISLEEALRDPAYARIDGYTGRFGPSWLHRWAMAAKKPREFYAGEPEVPRWVLDLAGVDSE
jgi:peptidoglycan/xylan/chitin deacetylase (PgdA/CDA1 family)